MITATCLPHPVTQDNISPGLQHVFTFSQHRHRTVPQCTHFQGFGSSLNISSRCWFSSVTRDSCLFPLAWQDSVWSTTYGNMKLNTLNNGPGKPGWWWCLSIFCGSSPRTLLKRKSLCQPNAFLCSYLLPICWEKHPSVPFSITNHFLATVSQRAVSEFISFWFRARDESESSIWFSQSPSLILVVVIFLVTSNFDCSGQEVLFLELTQVLIICKKNLDRFSSFQRLHFRFHCSPRSLI